jgi:hypothetical protein
MNILWWTLLIIILILAMGCAAVKPIYMPIAAKCELPSLPKELHYPIADLQTGDAPAKVMKAYVNSIQTCISDDRYCRKICEKN